MDSTVRQYLDQYVKTAGRGNVEVEWAVLTQRVHFICKKCKEELTSSAPIDLYTIDYDIQDWVRFHSFEFLRTQSTDADADVERQTVHSGATATAGTESDDVEGFEDSTREEVPMRVDKPTVAEYVECLAINRKSFQNDELAPDGIFLTAWDQGTIFVHRSGPSISGFAIVTRKDGCPYLWVIAVKTTHRGCGIGTKLLEEIWAWCEAENERRIELTVKADNPAQKLYFDNGYRVVRVLRGYYVGGDGLLMRRVK